MAIGRITGPLLNENLTRDGVNLRFDNDLLSLDVKARRVGIVTQTPRYTLDVIGDIHASKRLFVDSTGTISLVNISSSTTGTSFIETIYGPLVIRPGGEETVTIVADTTIDGNLHVTKNITSDGDVRLGDNTSTDAVVFESDIKSDIVPWINTTTTLGTGTLTVVVTNTNLQSDWSLGTTSAWWLSAFVKDLHSDTLDTLGTSTDLQVFPDIPRLERLVDKTFTINGDIRVYGNNPIGTSPVVNNVLYVNENGDDENDGRAMDSSRACRTISGAVNSPYYKQGTVIKVAAGYYAENNPVELLPYTSIVGDNLRATFVEPLNKTVDLFHVNSGVYLAYMTMINLKKGEVTRYKPGGAGTYTTGAYCVAFPPKLDNPIDVFHSPYIQNCTNQSGPWLVDETMFVPNNTVQVPLVVGTSTYEANTTTITIYVDNILSSEMIKVGMAVNGAGITINPDLNIARVTDIINPDYRFQNARTLLEENKSFMQTEIVAYINSTFPSLVYDENLCRRDTGYIIDAIINDAIIGGNAEIVYAGRKYFENNINLLGAELEPTITAYNYLATIMQSILDNVPILTSPGNTESQTFDIDLTSATVAVPNILSSVELLIDVMRNQQGYENAAALLNANRGLIQSETVGFVNQNFVGQPVDSFTYDKAKCFRDVGYILDALQTDLVYGGNQQTIYAGEQYWSGTTSTISTEISETIAAYNYLKQVTSAVILNDALIDPYVSTVTQNVSTFATGTNAAAELVARNIALLTDIIERGPDAVPPTVANSATSSTVFGIVNAYNVLAGNRAFIQHEIVNFVDTSFTQLNFTYDAAKCERDTGLIVDSIAMDLIYQSDSNTTFAGLQYWDQSVSEIAGEETTTTNAFLIAKSISQSVVQGILVPPMQGGTLQVTSSTVGNITVANAVGALWDVVINIISTGTVGVTDSITPNGAPSTSATVLAGYELLKANKDFIKEEVIAWVDSNAAPGFTYDRNTCRRDTGYVVDCILIDLLRGGNRQSVQAGTYYYGYDSTSTVLVNEVPQTTAAYKYLKFLVDKIVKGIKVTTPYQEAVGQELQLASATDTEVTLLENSINIINKIIRNGPSVAGEREPLPLTYSTSTNLVRAYDMLMANRTFIQKEVVAYVNKTFINPYTFQYNEDLCFRDVGLIIDAMAEDLTQRSNVRSLYAGQQYWDGAVSLVEGEIKQTVSALQYAKQVALDVIANNPIINSQQTGTTASIVTQNINPQLQGGGVAGDLLEANFNAITTIIELGPDYAPPSTNSTLTEFIITISTSTFATATNDTMYFGDVTVYPVEDKNIPGEWGPYGVADRRIDIHGSGGGALVDGNAPSRRSPIQSFVFDAFTQLNQGGTGVHIINKGYAQLVSVFTIFCDIGVHVESGGIASIVNSNANFGDICLLAEGFGTREFGGTIYNPPNIFYNEITNEFEYNENYPQGYFPQNANVVVFVPDPLNRPHISLVMEVVPPDQYVDYDGNTVPYRNEQGFPGFLTAISNTSTLNVGSYEISGIDTSGIAVGQNLYIRDQYGYEADQNGLGTRYVNSTTYITSITYQTIYLNQPIQATGFEIGSPNYFNLYSCGNAYYTVLTSKTVTPPNPIGASKIRGQEVETIDAINYMKTVSQNVVSNILMTTTYTTASSQVINGALSGGLGTTAFIGNELDIITGVILKGPQNSPEITTTGTIASGFDDAIELLELNRIFIMDETVSYVDAVFKTFVYDADKCYRDTGLIVDAIAFDLAYGGTSQSTFAGLQYWSQTSDTESVIPGELTTTTDAITYAKNQAISIISGYGSAPSLVESKFNTILSILASGVSNITNNIVPNGLPTTDAQIINAYNTLVSSTGTIISNTISYINLAYPGFTYDQTTCARDLHYMLDSVSFDLLHGGNRQSTQSGAYYYGYTGTTQIPNEIPQTTAAYEFIKAVITDVVTGTPISPSYQNTVTQVTNLAAGLESQGLEAQSKVDVITTIINNGPTAVSEQLPIPLALNPNVDVQNAFKLILANRAFIQAETIAYVNNEYTGFTYNKQKCRRDVGLLIDALQADLETGGNFRAVEAAKTYYSKEGTYHLVELEDQVRNPLLFVDGSTVNFYQRSYMSASGYVFEYVGAGTQYGALPQVGRVDPNQSKETVQLNNGKVFFTSTDQNGDFRIGPTLVISQATGVLSGRTFEKSLFAQMTPFILAVEAG